MRSVTCLETQVHVGTLIIAALIFLSRPAYGSPRSTGADGRGGGHIGDLVACKPDSARSLSRCLLFIVDEGREPWFDLLTLGAAVMVRDIVFSGCKLRHPQADERTSSLYSSSDMQGGTLIPASPSPRLVGGLAWHV